MAKYKRTDLIAIGLIVLAGLWFFFVSTNVNPTLGTIYNGLVILAISSIFADILFGKQQIKFINSSVSWGEAIVWGVGGYIAVLLSTQFTSALAQVIPLKELLGLLGSSAPVFSNSKLLNWITFGQVIAFIETYALFVAAPDLFASIFKIDLNKKNILNPKLILLILSFGFLFLLLHVTAKGIQNEAILLLVFIMAIISIFVTVWTQDARPALIIHILANSIAATSIFVITGKAIIPLLNIIPLIGG